MLPIPPSAVGLCIGVLAGALFSAPVTAWTDLGIFDGRRAATAWHAPSSTPVLPRPGLFRDAAGVEFAVPMHTVADRVYRDADLHLDLASFSEFSLSLRLEHPAAVSRATLYFKSGNGWYGGWFNVHTDGWQTITLARDDFAVEGMPSGWHRIDGIRIALWKAADINTRVGIAAIRARVNPVAILRNSDAITTLPGEKISIERAVNRLTRWLRGYGLNVAVMDDHDLKTGGIPAACRLIILPYNPQPPETTLKALQAFTARGGRLITIYTLEQPRLAALLGLGNKRWMRADPPDALAVMRFKRPGDDGLPITIRQNSWNANIPEVLTASVLASWHNSAGEDSGLPSVTLGKNGAFIGHILTNVERERKIEMLLALAVMLVPDLMPLLTAVVTARADTLFEYADWPQTRTFIVQTAHRHGRTAHIAGTLRELDRLRADGGDAPAPRTFGDVLARTATRRRLILKAYSEAVAPGAFVARRELRGVWCHDAGGIPGRTWAPLIRELKAAGFNTLFANHLWGGLAYYPSEVLPVSPRIASEGDLLRQCLDACRTEGIALHVWQVLWVLDNAPAAFVADMERSGRLMQDRTGKSGTWLCPTHPANMDLAVNAACEVGRHYAVAGVHLDYARYPDANSCYCNGCAGRFRAATGRTAVPWPASVVTGTDRDAFLAWRRDQITVTVARIGRELKAIRPDIAISAAVWGNWPGVRDSIGQDWGRWCQAGLLDFVCPMNYVTSASEAVALFTGQLPAAGPSVPVYPGIAPTTHNLPPEEVIRQIDRLRAAGAKGFLLFELDGDLLDLHLPVLGAGATAK